MEVIKYTIPEKFNKVDSVDRCLDITIAIPVFNEEKNLQNCLDAIGTEFARKVVIIDSASNDRTRSIAEENLIECIDFKWNGKFPKKRNWFLTNYPIQTNWVLFLDADEWLSDEFKEEVRRRLGKEDVNGYHLNYSRYFLNRKLKGGYPLKKLAFFKAGKGEYERILEDHWSSLDMEIHEHLQISGAIGEFKAKIDHRDFRDISNYVMKHKEYALWESNRFFALQNNFETMVGWSWKQRIKYKLMNTFCFPVMYFIGSFFYFRGFLDGKLGLTFAILKMAYFNQVYCLIKERELREKREAISK